MVTGALFAFCRDEVVQCFRFSKIPFNRFIFVPDLIVGSSFVEPPIKCSHTDHWWRSWEPSEKLLDKLSEVCPKPLSWTSREACSSMKRPSRKQKQRWIAETVWADGEDFSWISFEDRCCFGRIRAVFRSFYDDGNNLDTADYRRRSWLKKSDTVSCLNTGVVRNVVRS